MLAADPPHGLNCGVVATTPGQTVVPRARECEVSIQLSSRASPSIQARFESPGLAPRASTSLRVLCELIPPRDEGLPELGCTLVHEIEGGSSVRRVAREALILLSA